MKNQKLQVRLNNEIIEFINEKRSLMLSSLCEDGRPYASYAPFAIGDECLYVLLSDIAIHGLNLKANHRAAVLIVQDESEAEELFARIRVNYSVVAQHIPYQEPGWDVGLDHLVQRHGDRISKLSEMTDFNLFKLVPVGGRYVKGFGKAYTIAEGSLSGEGLSHLTDGHKPRQSS